MRFLTVSIILFMIFIGTPSAIINPLCGPECLLAVMQYYKINSSIDELCELAGYDEEHGTSMMGLYQAAKAKGLPAVPLKLTWKKLVDIDGPKIVFVNDNHFLVVYEGTKKSVLLQDFPDAPKRISKENFLNMWEGEALVFSEELDKRYGRKFERSLQTTNYKKTPLQKKGPRVTFPLTKHDFGTVFEGDSLSYVFLFKSTGTKALTVFARSGCSCTTALLTDNTLLPGDTGKLKVSYKTKGLSGNGKQSIQLRTNDPEKKWTTLTVSANVLPSIKAVPEQLYLSEVKAGEYFQREILVMGGDKLLINSFDVTDEIEAKIGKARSSEKGRVTIPIYLNISVDQPPGMYERLVTIHTNSDRTPSLSIPIKGAVIGDVVALPPKVFFASVKIDGVKTKEVTLKYLKNGNISVSKVKHSSPLITTTITKTSDSIFKLFVNLNAPDHATTIRDTLQVFLSGRKTPDLKIPVYALVTSQQLVTGSK